ncbi:iron(II)-dependent oxidoreductase EgtB [Janthinobacterium sp. MP5059B]|uniref:selenoneine synthase SenA n=1 Tax=Janthinobacterium sp. MP5059B TaxID=1766683 RepID=UPI00089309AF|nr:selenoneine synthase SenA [Janthinobacterium sp. MP5059B]OEZ48702.1 iron(II)-dependent oxidoreductase EgtB [Janthinobacterium sp. MP5059B]
MTLINASFRHAGAQQLAQSLQAARQDTLSLFDCYVTAGLDVVAGLPRHPRLTPPLWQLAHIAWFAEWFILREAASSHPADAIYNSLLTRGDDLFDANMVEHRARWKLELPSPGAVKTYCHEVLDRVLDKLSREANVDSALAPYRLALAHEDLCGEEMLAGLQWMGLEAPESLAASPALPPGAGEIAFPGGTIELGSPRGAGFAFDNESPPYSCYVAPFSIDACAVSNAQFADFVADGGYQNRQFWSAAGSAWLMQQERSSPLYWLREATQWRTMRFGQRTTLPPNEAVRHINLYEAQAYCAWAGRRLATEAEWEYAALSGHPRFHWGQVWEWTATPFEPYPGFAVDAWREYSAPYFMQHQVLRGAAFATPPRLHSARMRAFHAPERGDIFAGLRTCAW